MYFLNSKDLANTIKNNHVSFFSKLLYIGSFALQIMLKISVFNFVPWIYYFIFSKMKIYIETQTKHPSLILEIFYDTNNIFNMTLLSIGIIGLIILVYTICRKGSSYIAYAVYLNWPITMRIFVITAFIFLLATTVGMLYFGKQLYALIPPPKDTSLKPWKILFRVLRKVNVIKKLSDNLALLQKAQIIFYKINIFSLIMYLASYVMAVFSSIVYFVLIIKRLRKI